MATESRQVIRGWGNWGMGELLFNGSRVSIWDDGKVLEMDSDDGCITVEMNLMQEKCTLEIG